MTNILVVGGAGYIGSAVTAHLVRAGHAVTVFDDLSHGHRAAVPTSIELVVGDVESGLMATLNEAPAANPDAVNANPQISARSRTTTDTHDCPENNF